MSLVTVTQEGDVGVLTVNNPPVNALSPGVPEGLAAGVGALRQDAAVRAIVLIGGGPMWYADTVGLKQVYDRVCQFEKQHGDVWAPAPLLKRLAESGKTFADLDQESGSS